MTELRAKGVEYNWNQEEPDDPLSWTMDNSYMTAFEIVMDYIKTPPSTFSTSLLRAAARGDKGMIKKYLQYGSLVKYMDENKYAWSLMNAITLNGSFAIFKTLLESYLMMKSAQILFSKDIKLRLLTISDSPAVTTNVTYRYLGIVTTSL